MRLKLMRCRQKENGADHTVSYIGGILDLDLYADGDDDSDAVSEHAADGAASREDEQHSFLHL